MRISHKPYYLAHRGFDGFIRFPREAEIFYGRVTNLLDVKKFYLEDGVSFKEPYEDAIEEYLVNKKETSLWD